MNFGSIVNVLCVEQKFFKEFAFSKFGKKVLFRLLLHIMKQQQSKDKHHCTTAVQTKTQLENCPTTP